MGALEMNHTGNFPPITFAMTAGRRLGLWRKTMASFLYRCADLDLIEDWVICDDRSSAADLDEMRRAMPWARIISASTPGQGASLNRLYHSQEIKTDWVCHYEDDWRVVRAGHFIREALRVAETHPKIRNVVFRKWDGVYVRYDDVQYTLHVYRKDIHEGRDEDAKCIATKRADATWLGHTLNPSLQHAPTMRELGRYAEDSPTRFFDRPQARKFLDLGLLRANTWNDYVEHVGSGQSYYETQSPPIR